jgi:TRAP-type uncharacterized transport system substrate-binding protein
VEQEQRTTNLSAVTRRFLGAGALLLLVVSLVVWWFGRDRLPARIRIATGAAGGLYHRFGELLAPHLERRTGHPVEVLTTDGSNENQRRLREGSAELALLQEELADSAAIGILAPLYYDIVHVVVRREVELDEIEHFAIEELVDAHIAIGLRESGMRRTAEVVLRHYRIDPPVGEAHHFTDLETQRDLDAAIVTTGLLNPDLGRLLGSGNYLLLPIPDAEALARRSPFLDVVQIPRGFYREQPAVPSHALSSIATASLLCAAREASGALVQATLMATYEDLPRRELPTLFTRREAAEWDHSGRHPEAISYFQPYSGLGILANMMESLAALKELLFALGAAVYLGFAQWRRRREREREAEVQVAKERLDILFQETIAIERRQMVAEDATELRRHLDDVTRLKLRALDELTHEDLRGDVTFAIFLQQCANLTRKIQSKVEFFALGGTYPQSDLPNPGRKGVPE